MGRERPRERSGPSVQPTVGKKAPQILGALRGGRVMDEGRRRRGPPRPVDSVGNRGMDGAEEYHFPFVFSFGA
jgi:hypothetical protein